ncbi:MAG: 16S rRNA (cytosine(1402)-N(4))-methyltransferase RsmH [Hyphomicrobiales bacterium]|nr:16S rRNA (cytosine(1402)-N(4))-methyltransferase RsmH [Hyphomicrobiales bacterium]
MPQHAKAGPERRTGRPVTFARGEELSAEAAHLSHLPVLLPEVMEALQAVNGGRYIDATFGGGGYCRALLSASPSTRVLALDRDPEAVREGQTLVERAGARLTLAQARFGEIARVAREHGFDDVDGIAFDVGVSSMQIDRPERGFSFRHDGPLDMRMSREGPSAADLIATSSVEELADLLRLFGEERHAGRIARAIVKARTQDAPITTTRELRRLVASAVPAARDGIDPATRTFQALRIAVNDELGELVGGLVGATSLLKPGGRLAVVTFHSLEDRIVKRFLQGNTGREQPLSRHLPTQRTSQRAFAPAFGPITPGETELAGNPRARSAKLRWGTRTHSPLSEGFAEAFLRPEPARRRGQK